MGNDDRVVQIMRRLLEQTQDKKLDWERGVRGDQKVWSNWGSSVTIESVDGDGIFPYRFRVLNERGEVVASQEFLVNDPDARLANQLFTAAHKNSLKVDDTLNGLLASLEDPKSSGDRF